MANVIKELKKRGFIQEITSDELVKLAEKPLAIYLGFDPTGDSLHLGHLVGIMALAWFQRYGHTPYALIGGATGRIGDPSGKSIERPFLQDNLIQANAQKITLFLKELFQKNPSSEKGPKPIFINNNDWFKELYFIDFLRDVGKHFRIGSMLAKESVKLRMDSEEGISFTEFSYQILQAYDFYHLFTEKNIMVQAGGSDQWGNITAGVELVRRKTSKNVHGFTFPLLTSSDGKKFGKSESGAIWLSQEKLCSYEFYQYLYKVADADVIVLLKMLTFLPVEEIEKLQKEMTSDQYETNKAQKLLASEVTRFIHGEEGLKSALEVTAKAKPGAEAVLKASELEKIFHQMPHLELSGQKVIGQKITELFHQSGLTSSKTEALRLIKNGGAYLNNEKISDENYLLEEKDLIEKRFLVLAKGKKNKVIIKIVS